MTEGKTDITYLKAALKNLHDEYPELITKNTDGTFEYKVSFLKRTKRLRYFLNINLDGASALNNIYDFFSARNTKKAPNYSSYFKKLSNSLPKNPVILVFDNELNSKNKPISKFCNNSANLDDEKMKDLENEYMVNVIDNLYLLTVPLIGEKSECDIEDLFEEITLLEKIDGKEFTKQDDYDVTKFYGKEIFSKYILRSYTDVNFKEFRPVLDNINNIIVQSNGKPVALGDGSDVTNLKSDSTDKIALEI